jgi:hypothetical protein
MAITHGDKILTLTGSAYLDGGTQPLGGGAYLNGDYYRANAQDAEGNEYRVFWTDFSLSADGDDSGACDWNQPDYIVAL